MRKAWGPAATNEKIRNLLVKDYASRTTNQKIQSIDMVHFVYQHALRAFQENVMQSEKMLSANCCDNR